jgi:hypothetical protein
LVPKHQLAVERRGIDLCRDASRSCGYNRREHRRQLSGAGVAAGCGRERQRDDEDGSEGVHGNLSQRLSSAAERDCRLRPIRTPGNRARLVLCHSRGLGLNARASKVRRGSRKYTARVLTKQD